MTQFIIVLILSFCAFIAALIVFTRKEEAVENSLMNSDTFTNGYIDKVERTGKSLSKGNLIFTYSVLYKYEVNGQQYTSKVLYEVQSDVLDVFPEIVEVHYNKENPKSSIVKVDLNRTKIKRKETVKSLIPSIIIALIVCAILMKILVAPLL